MATFQEPLITRIFWGGADLQNLMWALYRHFSTHPNSLFTPSLQTEITTGSLGAGTYSFTLTPKDAGETWQLNFRNSGTQGTPNSTTINLGIDPGATIVDSSSNPPSSDSDFSGETSALQITTGSATDGSAYVLEYDDSLGVILPSGTSSPQSIPHGFLAGKVWTAVFANDPTLGRDGLAVVGHIPRITTVDAGEYWLTNNVSSLSLFHLGTDSWDSTVAAALNADLAQSNWLEEGGATSPGPVVLTYNLRPIGTMKHVFYMAPKQTPFKRFLDNNSIPRYLTIEADYSGAVITWDSSTVPPKFIASEEGVATYAELSVDASHGDFDKVTSGTATGVYQYVAEVGGDTFGMWLPSDYAARVTDYVRDASSNPCKISMTNGVGGDTRSTLLSRGWSEATTGTGSTADSSGDLELLGGSGSANFSFSPVSNSIDLAQLLLVAEVNVETVSGVRSGRLLLRGNSVSSFYPITLSWALGSTANTMSFVDNATELTQVGQGSLSLTSFDRMFGELTSGWTSGGTGSPVCHLWEASTGQVVTDSSAVVTDFSLVSSTAELVQIGTYNTGGSNPVFYVREFHLFQMEG